MAITNVPLEIVQARGPEGPGGDATLADIAAAVTALKGGASTSFDTLKKLEDGKAPQQNPDFTTTEILVRMQSAGNSSNKASSTAFVQQELTNAIAVLDAALASAITGLDTKASVRAATTPADTAIVHSGIYALDGVTLIASDRVLDKNNATAALRGIWVVAAGSWVRADDFDVWSEIPGAIVPVEEGSVNADTGWLSTADRGGTLNTTAITFVQAFGNGLYSAGAGLSLISGVFAIADPELLAIAGLTSAADKGIYFTASGAAATFDLTAFGRSLAAGANAAAARTTLGMVIGTDVEAHDATLTALAGVTTAADKLIYATGADAFATTDLTAAARSVLDDTTTAAMLTTLGALPLAGGAMTGALTLAADPVSALQAATKQYVDGIVAAQDAMVFKGVIDCSANPNYPAADRGHTYRVSVAGKIGGASGTNVEVGDTLICLTDGTAAGTQAGVGANWGILQNNLDGAVIGPASASDGNLTLFNGGSGKLIKDGGVISAFGLSLVDDANAATARTTLGLAIGTDVEAHDATLTALAGVTTAADKLIYATGADVFAVTDFSVFARTLVDDADAATARATLGVDAVLTNTRLAKTANYTVANADKGKTIALGGAAFYTLTFSAISGGNYDANFAVRVLNEDTGRGKTISVAGTTFLLYPGQECVVYNQNSVWIVGDRARWKLTADTTLNVNIAAGANSNDGLATGAGNAKATIQAAINSVLNDVDLGGFNVTISVVGTPTEQVTLSGPFFGTGSVKLAGDTSTPSNVSWSNASTILTLTNKAVLSVEGFKMSSSGVISIAAERGSICIFSGKMEFGANGSRALNATMGAVINAPSATALIISGGGGSFAQAFFAGMVDIRSTSITVSGTPAFSSAFAVTDQGGFIRFLGPTFTGSATGKRYDAQHNAMVDTGGAGATYLPGDAAGTTATGGLYI